MNKKWALIPTLPILEIHPTSTADFSKEDKLIFWDHKAKTLKTPNTADFSNKADDNQQIIIYGWTKIWQEILTIRANCYVGW